MVMGEMGLSRIEELPHTITRELRPALALGDPAVLFVDLIRHALVNSGYTRPNPPVPGCWPATWLTTHRKLVIAPLARRFQNVANRRWSRKSRGFAVQTAPDQARGRDVWREMHAQPSICAKLEPTSPIFRVVHAGDRVGCAPR
jgi:hypothetical protein